MSCTMKEIIIITSSLSSYKLTKNKSSEGMWFRGNESNPTNQTTIKRKEKKGGDNDKTWHNQNKYNNKYSKNIIKSKKGVGMC